MLILSVAVARRAKVGLGGGVDRAIEAEWRSYVAVVIVVRVVGAAKVDLDRVILCTDA